MLLWCWRRCIVADAEPLHYRNSRKAYQAAEYIALQIIAFLRYGVPHSPLSVAAVWRWLRSTGRDDAPLPATLAGQAAGPEARTAMLHHTRRQRPRAHLRLLEDEPGRAISWPAMRRGALR